MTSELVYVALGSNLGDREQHLQRALVEIAGLPGVADVRSSSVYETDPMGPQNQPDYLNAVCTFQYAGTPQALLSELQAIEASHGRVKTTERWTARPLDLDILLFGEQRINEPDLQVPHVGIGERSFVLWPLRELNPNLLVPGKGSVADLCRHCQRFGIKRFNGAS